MTKETRAIEEIAKNVLRATEHQRYALTNIKNILSDKKIQNITILAEHKITGERSPPEVPDALVKVPNEVNGTPYDLPLEYQISYEPRTGIMVKVDKAETLLTAYPNTALIDDNLALGETRVCDLVELTNKGKLVVSPEYGEKIVYYAEPFMLESCKTITMSSKYRAGHEQIRQKWDLGKGKVPIKFLQELSRGAKY